MWFWTQAWSWSLVLLPESTSRISASASSTGASSSFPLSMSIASRAACPTRLFPSTNGWFLISEKPSGGFLNEAGVEIVASKGLLRLAESRFQHAEIPKTVGTTGLRDDPIVKVEDLSQAEVADHRSRW